ncbi:MAG TPA: hypothetical protein VFV79_04355 [Saprospiraceae bacterium]|nr:hypothetical protein [Saprospiraceae bacterium]
MKMPLFVWPRCLTGKSWIIRFFWIIFLLPFTTIHAQKYYTAEKSFGLKLGTTKPLYSSYAFPSTDAEKIEELEKNSPHEVPNFFGRRQLTDHNPHALPKGPDPTWKGGSSRNLTDILPIANFEGLNENQGNGTPPDVNGDIGKDFYMQAVNSTTFRVYNKMGQPVSAPITTNSIWSQVGQNPLGDPIILYDQVADRWFLTEFASFNQRRVLIAVSTTSDPRGSWTAYAFQTPRFPDFPKYGIWSDYLLLTTNETGMNAPFYAFNRNDLLTGEDTVRMQRLTLPKIGGADFEVNQPVDWDGLTPPPPGSPGIALKLNDDGWGKTTFDHIRLQKITIDWENKDSSNIEVLSIATQPFDTDGCQLENTGGYSCIPQPNGQGIDGAKWIILNKAHYRNFGDHEAFVMCFMADVNGEDVAGIRWMEFRRTQTEDWHLYQEGMVGSDDGLHRFMGSIALDGQGNIGLGYSVSGYEKNPSLRYTGRFSYDPLGEMTFNEYEFAAGTGSTGQDRFGDYASMSVDPTDDATFWFTGEYIKAQDNWATRIVAFSAARDSFDLLPVSLEEPGNSANLTDAEPLTITVLNRGLNTVYQFDVAYQFNNGSWVTEPAAVDSLLKDSSYIHTFSSTLSFPSTGVYPIRIATGLANDQNPLNDTLSYIVQKYAHKDVGVEYIPNGTEALVCSTVMDGAVRLRNLGGDTLFSVKFEIILNGSIVNETTWNGVLPFGEETFFNFAIAPLATGVNTFRMIAVELNGDSDEMPDNNEVEYTITTNPAGHHLTLSLKTDNFPFETSWNLFDSENNIVYSSNILTESQHVYVTDLCLEPEACYTFTVYDAAGDGMSANGVQGDYEIINDDDQVVSALAKPNFGSQVSSQFCLTGICLFDLEVGVQPESFPGANDGVVIGETANSLGNITYSLDGQNFQASNVFTNLSAGVYTMIAVDGAGCQDTTSFEIISCSLEALITTKPASGGDVGEIHVSVLGAHGEVLYSLNGGTFSQDSFFVMLEPGDYVVTVRDSAGCEVIDTVTVSTQVSTTTPANKTYVSISPNPGDGVYQITASFDSKEIFLPFYIVTSSGEPVIYSSVVRYDDVYRHELSLYGQPPGVYYIVFNLGSENVVRKIVKTN